MAQCFGTKWRNPSESHGDFIGIGTLIFVVPILLLELPIAIVVSVAWGLGILSILSYKIAVSQGTKPWRVVTEHLLIAVVVIIITHFVGDLISTAFS